jgi:alkaline phosphatase
MYLFYNRWLIFVTICFSSFDRSTNLTKHLASGTDIRRADPSKETMIRPRNIIFLIGDGMGLTQVSAGMFSNNNHLNLERCPITGLMKTHSSNHLITDSAAGATAFSCGCKTYNGAVGMSKDKKHCKTLLEEAEENGLATGLVATSQIAHATPAAYIAHVADRSKMEEVATWFLKTDIDLFIGGGMKHFTQRADGRDLYQELVKKNVFVSDFRSIDLAEMDPSPLRPFAWFSANDLPKKWSDGRTYLPVAGRIAPRFLKERSKEGFFLMIEGSQIDWGGHAKNATYTIEEMLDFDRTIGEVLDWAKLDGETLVVITADHETGGMAIMQGSEMNKLEVKFNSDYHTATMVPVFAFGPGAELFGGMYDNTQIYHKMRTLLFGENAMTAK